MSIKIRIVSDFDKRGLTEAEKALGGLSRAAGIALAAVGAAVAGIAVKSVQEFAKFDAALTQSRAIMGDLTKAMEDDMARAAREVAKTTTFSAEQAAESFFFLASAGLDAEASIAALPRVAQFAQAGMFDMSRATDLLTDAQSALGLTIRDDAVKNMENMIKVSDVLVRANTLSNATVEQFSTSLTTKAGAALRGFGIDMEEGVAVLAAFADQGIKGEEAGTRLEIVLKDLSTKAIKNKEEFQKFGVSVFDSTGEMRNLGDIVADMEGLLGSMSDETKKATLLQLGFSDRSVGAMMSLLGTSDAIKNYEKELRSASGFTDEVATKQLETFNSQLKLLESAFIDVGIQIGEELTPYLQDLIPVLQDLLPIVGQQLADAFKKVDWEGLITSVGEFVTLIVDNLDNIGRLIGVIVGISTALVTYTAVTKIATTAQKIFNSTLLLNPWGLAAVAVLGLTYMLIRNNGEVDKATENYRQLNSQIDQANYTQKNLADTYRESAYVAGKYGIETDELRNANLKLAGAADMVSGELGRFNTIKMNGIRAELAATTNTAAALGAQLANNQRQLYYAMQGIDIEGTGIFNVEPVVPSGPSAYEQTRDQVQRLIKDSQKQLADAQKQYNKTVVAANESYASNVERLQLEYANRLEGIIQQSQQRLNDAYKSAVAVNISSLFERDENKSVEGLVKSLSDKLTASRNLLSNSAELASAGFSQTFIEQIVSAGTETGNELASAILDSTPEVQRELQELFRALEIESTQGMDALAESIYEKQGLATDELKELYAQTGNDLIEALENQQTILDQALLDANNKFAESVQTIKEKVLDDISEMEGGLGGLGGTVDMFIGKLDKLIAKYGEATEAMKIPAAPAPAPAPSGGGGGGGGAPSVSEPSPAPITGGGTGGTGGGFQPPKVEIPEPLSPGQIEALKRDQFDPRVGNTININVKTDATQSPSMVGSYVAKAVEKYTSLGGSIKGLKVVPI